MFASAEEKAEVLALLDEVRKAIEEDEPRKLQACLLQAFVYLFRSIAKDVPGALPLVIMEKNP